MFHVKHLKEEGLSLDFGVEHQSQPQDPGQLFHVKQSVKIRHCAGSPSHRVMVGRAAVRAVRMVELEDLSWFAESTWNLGYHFRFPLTVIRLVILLA
jgi:hypothetical protein